MSAIIHTAKPDNKDSAAAAELKFAISFFEDVYAAEVDERRLLAEQLVRLLRRICRPTKEELPLLKLARFGDKVTDNRALRHNANVIAISGVEADYDGEEGSFDDAVDILKRVNVTAILYTSPSHTEAKPRWRVLCPTSKEYPPGERDRFMGRLAGVFETCGSWFAPESWTLSQGFYFGRVADAPDYRVEVVDGTPIDLHDDLDSGAARKPNGRAHGRHEGQPHADITDIEAALARIPNNDRDWDGLCGRNSIGLAVYRASGGSEDGFSAFDRWSAKSAKYNATETRKRWDHFHRSPPSRIGFGTLVHLARETEPDWMPSRGEDERPTIELRVGERPRIVGEAIDALDKANVPFYRRGLSMVHVAKIPVKASDGSDITTPAIVTVPTQQLAHELGKAACWQKYDGRRDDWAPADVPADVAAKIAALPNEWHFKPLTGIIATQTLRPDGTLLVEPGYDPASGYLLFDPPKMPRVPDEPTQKQALDALDTLDELLDAFPFVFDPGAGFMEYANPSRSVKRTRSFARLIRRILKRRLIRKTRLIAPAMKGSRRKRV